MSSSIEAAEPGAVEVTEFLDADMALSHRGDGVRQLTERFTFSPASQGTAVKATRLTPNIQTLILGCFLFGCYDFHLLGF